MEKGAQASDCDSDETVIEGSVTENELEDEELLWRRLLLNQDTTSRSELYLHPGVNGMWKGMPSPEIQLGLKPRKDSQEQKNKDKALPALSEDPVVQVPQDETIQNQVLLQTRKQFPAFTVSFPHPEVSWSHQNTEGPDAENCENLPHPEKELNETTDSPEISLLSGTSLVESDSVALKEKSLTEPVKTLAVPDTFSEPGKEVTLTMTSKETKDEESSLETFVSVLEGLLESPGGTQEETLLEIMNDSNPQELLNPLSSVSFPLNALSAFHRDVVENMEEDAAACYIDVLENMKDDAALPAELLATINALPGDEVGPICQEQEKSSAVSGGNGCLQVQPMVSQIDEDCTQIEQTIEDVKPFSLPTLTHENATSYKQLNNKGNSDPLKSTSVQETPYALRKSSRLEKLKASRDVMHTDVVLKIPERILLKTLSCEHRIDSNFSTDNFRMQDSALMIDSKRKDMHSSRSKSKQRRKKEHRKIKNGWTALHEASVGGNYETVSELLKGGAYVNVKGKCQITPLHDAVMNGHYKVAELLLLNGADPLCRSDHGTCALDEARDSFMENLLMKYIPEHKKCQLSAQRKSTDPTYVEDIFQFKKPKLSSNNYTEFNCGEKFNRQEPGHVEINKRSNNLLINKEYVHEYCQKNSQTTKFGKSKPKKSTIKQTNSTGLRGNNLHNRKNSRTKNKGRRNRQPERTQEDDKDCSLSQGIALSSLGGMNTLVPQYQHTVQTLDALPEESRKLSTPTLPSLENGIDSNEAALPFTKSNTHILGLPGPQEVQFLELESIDEAKAASFSELSSYKEIKWPHVTADPQAHTNQEPCNSPAESPEDNHSDEKGKSSNKWENSFLSFIKGFCADSDSDCHTSDNEGIGHCHKEESMTNREVDSQQFLPSEKCSSQEDEPKVGSLTTYPQEEAVNSCDLNNTLISEENILIYEKCVYGIAFDHSYFRTKQSSVPHIRLPSAQTVSRLTVGVEQLHASQASAHRVPTPSVNEADDTHDVEKQDPERERTAEGQNPASSTSPVPTSAPPQVPGTAKTGKRRQDLPGIRNHSDLHSADNVKKELANSSQLNQGKEKEIAYKSDEEVTINPSRAERTVKYCKEKKENMNSETHMPCDTQEHRKDQNFRKRKSSLKAPCSQEANTAGVSKRDPKGESRLHLASRRGNLSLVKVLIESGANVNLKDNAGWTPLHEAASEGLSDVIIELLKAGADVNCENIDGILPLHGAVAGNHLKAAEILLEHGANPNQKDEKQRTALEEADDDKMKELLKSYGATESNDGDESNSAATVKIPAVRPKRYKQCIGDDDKTIGSPSPLHKAKRSESLPAHQTISAILQDIEEKQENLLKFEIRNSEDAEQYIEKMSEIKEVMNNILAQQKTERDDLAKKYRVSMESFKHGALREQLANLAARQKSLLVVAKKHKKIRLKIQNYKNATALPAVNVRKLPCSSDISSEKSHEPPGVESSAHSRPGSPSPVSLAHRSIQEIPPSPEIPSDSQNTNICLNAEAVRREVSGNVMNSKQNVQDCALDGFWKPRPSDGTEKITSSSQSVALTPQEENSQADNIFTGTVVKGNGFESSPVVTGTANISEDKSIFSQIDACPPAVPQNQGLSRCNPKRRNRKTASQQPALVHQGTAALDAGPVPPTRLSFRKTASVASPADGLHIAPSSLSAHQQPAEQASQHSTTASKKTVQLKDLILLGRINPGNDILEFKTQETTHRASVLLSGKLKVENGQIYKNPVSWLKDLLGGGSYVTWNYAWSKVTYLGKELLKYVSEEAPVYAEPQNAPQQHQPCLPGTSGKPLQSFPHYLQIKEILLINDRELLPCHVMEQHWKFYVECKTLTF
ncbi:ankyrin repeat domain-containing protein 31 [Acomys russatus]|uniref:ankyrin repeat domain-containing protein 31 n=1 Tax=Acomys russatus TaxID=60746 RepID=UPI0021E1EE10|nr:ankyrin repeat domain-containing protein 31 [Acomys russatus]